MKIKEAEEIKELLKLNGLGCEWFSTDRDDNRIDIVTNYTKRILFNKLRSIMSDPMGNTFTLYKQCMKNKKHYYLFEPRI